MSDSTFRGKISFADIQEAVGELKRLDPVTQIETGDMLPFKLMFPMVEETAHVSSLLGVNVVFIDSMPKDDFKLVYRSGKEQKLKWR